MKNPTKPKNIYKVMRGLVKSLGKGEQRSDSWNKFRLQLLTLVNEHPGIAFSVYKLHPEEYKAALENCKHLFGPRIFKPEQEFFDWTHKDAEDVEAEIEARNDDGLLEEIKNFCDNTETV